MVVRGSGNGDPLAYPFLKKVMADPQAKKDFWDDVLNVEKRPEYNEGICYNQEECRFYKNEKCGKHFPSEKSNQCVYEQ